MKRCALSLAALTALFTGGCQVLQPVVDGVEIHDHARPPTCDRPVACRLLDDPPPTSIEESEILAPVDLCSDGMTPRTLTLTDDLTLDGPDLSCTALTVDVAPTDPSRTTPVTLTIRGPVLHNAAITMRGARALAVLSITADTVVDDRFRAEDAVRIVLPNGAIERSTFELAVEDPLAAPELTIGRGIAHDVRIDAPRSAVRLRDLDLARAIVRTRSLTLEQGVVSNARIASELLELVGGDLVWVHLEVDRLIAAASQVLELDVARCGTLTFAQSNISGSRFEPCTDPLDLQGTTVSKSRLFGDVGGFMSSIARSAIASDRVDLSFGSISSSALCGTSFVLVASMACVACEPASPPEVCTLSLTDAPLCPQICDATCDRGLSVADVAPDACAE